MKPLEKKPTRLPESFRLSVYSLIELDKDDLVQTNVLRNNFNTLSDSLTDGSHAVYYEDSYMLRIKSLVRTAFPYYSCSLSFYITKEDDMFVDVTVICKGNEISLVKGTLQ